MTDKITMLPTLGDLDLDAAVDAVLPLLLDYLDNQPDLGKGNESTGSALPAVKQR